MVNNLTTEEKLQKINEIFARGLIDSVLPSKEAFIEQLLNKRLNFYIGFDPTNTSLHLGHAQNFMLMEQFRQLGHKIFILFGDFTACIGDPSERSMERVPLTREQTTLNAKNWREQVRNLIDFDNKDNPAEVVFNSTWLDKMGLEKLIELASQTTVQRMLERDMFKRRMAENKPVHLHEFLYPLFQGFDSVALNADVELCGTDQTFNALLGRQLVKTELNKEKFCVIVKLMNHPVTGEPIMSKSRGAGVFLNSDAKTMFGEIMALPDEMIEMVLKWNTTVSLKKIESLDVKNHPRDAKIFAGEKIVEIFFGKDEALKAKEHFINTFSKSVFPKDAKSIKIGKEEIELFEMLKLCEPLKSNSELRRLISQKAVSVDEEKINDEKKIIIINAEKRIRIGKLGFFKIIK